MRISEIAKAADVGVETVRYYQRIGLLRVPERSGTSRSYTAEDLRTLRFVRRAQALGFTLDEIATLLSLSSADCQDVERIARDRHAQVIAKIEALQRIEAVLSDAVTRCESHDPYSGCPVIESLVVD